MISPHSFLITRGHRQNTRPSGTPSISSDSFIPTPLSHSPSLSLSCSPTPILTSSSLSPSYHPASCIDNHSYPSKRIETRNLAQADIPSQLPWSSPRYDDETKPTTSITITSVQLTPDATMGKRKERRETLCLSPSSPPTTTTSLTTRPTTPTTPVKIPPSNRPNAHFHLLHGHACAHPSKRHTSQRRKARDSHSSDSISPSLANLLAVTDIPRPRHLRSRRRQSDKSTSTLSVDDLFDQDGFEKELSGSPMDVLLSPPQDGEDFDSDSVSDCNIGCALSTRTYSIDSIPSLDDSLSSDGFYPSPRTPNSFQRKRFSPMRKSLQPVLSPPGSVDEHPLAGESIEELSLGETKQPENPVSKSQFHHTFKPLRSAFKSNLTASLRALRSAAKSITAINFPSIPPDDFLTRSILTIDPNVPYADERRPPVMEEIPSAEIRRYLNPTSNARIELPCTKVSAGTFAASIQLRTYKIHRLPSAASAHRAYPSTSLQSQPSPSQSQPQSVSQKTSDLPPAVRQREMRENPDFIRIAVMEMAMRKRGKLDDQRQGRARWALPPRKMPTKPYEISSDGVPTRWIPICA